MRLYKIHYTYILTSLVRQHIYWSGWPDFAGYGAGWRMHIHVHRMRYFCDLLVHFAINFSLSRHHITFCGDIEL